MSVKFGKIYRSYKGVSHRKRSIADSSAEDKQNIYTPDIFHVYRNTLCIWLEAAKTALRNADNSQ